MESKQPGHTARLPIADQVNSLQHFQQHSRLHFIGQWKTRMEDLFKDWFTEHPEWNHGTLSQQRTFLHIDMDAFFCAVQLAKPQYAHLRDKPVGIAAGKFNSDISSCNYVARSFGVRAGMYVNAAKEICPDLVTIGYDLEACAHVAKELYRILFELFPASARMSLEVYSIDEVMIATDTTDYDVLLAFCHKAREELVQRTGCSASCGIGGNIMLARLATAEAKPNGVQLIQPADVPAFLRALPFSAIHGAGHSTMAKVHALLAPRDDPARHPGADEPRCDTEGDITCGHVQGLAKEVLQQALGKKAGESFYHLVRGIDSRVVVRTGDVEDQRALGRSVPNAVGCSMNYAVRPSCLDDVWSIVKQLLDDVCAKLKRGDLSAQGLRVTLLERHPLQPKEAKKYMGRGVCVEVHVPIRFPHPLDHTHEALMMQLVKEVVEPLMVESRTVSDQERARQLGLDKDQEQQIIWTFTLAALENIIIYDLRGMTIQASGLRAKDELPIRAKRDRGQMSLAAAFTRAKETKLTKSVDSSPPASVSSSQSSQSSVQSTDSPAQVEPAESLADAAASGEFEALLNCCDWRLFGERWGDHCRAALSSDNVPMVRALLRLALLKTALDERSRDDFTHLANSVHGNLLGLCAFY